MYKTGTQLVLTEQLLRNYSGTDFSPNGTLRKAKLDFKSGDRSSSYDVILKPDGEYLRVFLLLPNHSTKVAASYIRSNWYRDTGSLFEEDRSVASWRRIELGYMIYWILRDAQHQAKLTITSKPLKPDNLNDVKTCFNTSHKGVKNEVGSELELEAPTVELSNFSTNFLKRKVIKIEKMAIVDNIGHDCSVTGCGPEIRFRHPALGKWRKDAISRVISGMKEIGFSAGPSAGQHVHISHPKIRLAIYKCKMDIDGMNKFLKPISCRRRTSYGVDENIIRDQFNCFGTLEIRVWESTTNVDLFKKRLRFSNELVKCLLRKGVDYNNIWTKMPKTMGEDYVDMLFIDNPHCIGMSMLEVMELLPDSLKEYARNKYGWNTEQ